MTFRTRCSLCLSERLENVLNGSSTRRGTMSAWKDVLWQASEGIRIPQKIDTGIDLITAANVDDFLAAYQRRKAGGQ